VLSKVSGNIRLLWNDGAAVMCVCILNTWTLGVRPITLPQKLPSLSLHIRWSRSFARLNRPYFVTMQRDLVKTADCSKGRVPTTSEMFSTTAKPQEFSGYGIRKHSHLSKPSPDHECRTLTSPIVTIQAGKEETVAFNLHRVLVCNESARLAKDVLRRLQGSK
jgi:hypothetical protein